ncbi:hypothetical protein MTR67_002902 [Solanum verrucosum]|uniref:Reverse transcriptase zinc-binding domain-containing protein n=1 Tax=Solanum verrucosum TaxID=315347 RepID=A0AAF0T6D7_SOLVR|nr:hypothetical protein MTR67_002902 [Solanum verrucosum]
MDVWHKAGRLENLFPDISTLVSHQHKSIGDHWSLQGWNFIFRKHLNDWEMQRVTDFYNTIGPLNGLEGCQDTLWWKGNKKGIFKVNCAYNWLNNSYQLTSNWPWKGIWKSKIPLKVSCFVWLLVKEAILTQDNLMKRRIPLCSRCLFYGETVETVNHLFLHCRVTSQLWRLFLNLKGVSWVMPSKITETIQSWEEAGMQFKSRERWRIVSTSIWWVIWKERNSRCCDSTENSMEKVKLNCLLLLCFWCNQLYSTDTISLIDVLDSI